MMSRKVKVLLAYTIFTGIISISCAPRSASNEAIKIYADNNNAMNNAALSSSKASIWMGVYNNELYFCPFQGNYKGWLCKFGDSGILKVSNLKSTNVVYGLIDHYLYYNIKEKDEYSIACYDFNKDSIHIIYSGEVNSDLPVLIEEPSVFIPLGYSNFQAAPDYIHVKGIKAKEIVDQIRGTKIGDMTFYLPIESDSATISNVNRALISTDYGIVVHCQGTGDMLYLIDDNRLVQLFSVPCLSATSTITVVDDFIYLSILRYEKYGEIGMKRFKDDTLEGTYRIRLTDHFVEKISDKIYNGLYYFGDTCIYACDSDGGIYQLSLDGNEIDKLK